MSTPQVSGAQGRVRASYPEAEPESEPEPEPGQWGRKDADGKLERLTPTEDRSALHIAVEGVGGEPPNPMMVALLLDHGADPNVRHLE